MGTHDKMIKSRKPLHEGYVGIYECLLEVPVLAGGGTRVMKREVMVCTDAVVVFAHVPAVDSFLLTREYRAGVICNGGADDPLMWQCIAGALDKDLGIEQTARAEMKEEAGIDADRIDLLPIASVYASPGRMTEKVHVYLATLNSVPKTGLFGLAEEQEDIETALFERREFYRMMDEGKIYDSMTMLAGNWFRSRFG